MRNIFILSVLFSPLFLFSQEIDEQYLNSLPEDIRKDVKERIENKELVEKPIYRRASSFIDKELEEVEQTGIFGERFFDTIQSSFMPINEPNLDSSYVLDFGDIIEIQLIGQQDSIESYPIKRDGSITLKDIGKVFLSGLSLGDAASLVKAKVQNAYIGTAANISLTNIRDVSILIAGNAYNPGVYTLNGNSNILHAISMAGGVNNIGSYRNINLLRNGEIIDTLDLYDVLIYGKSISSSSLRSGDTVFVEPVGKVVSIENGVLRPGKYEMKDNENYEDLVKFANGLNPKADKDNIVLKRTFQGVNEIININFNNLASYEVKSDDSIFIREFRLNSIKISGAIKNPGTYQIPIGTTLSELIKYTGGYTDSAYPFAGVLTNQKALEINTNAKETLYNKFLSNLIDNSRSMSKDDTGLGLVLQQLRDAPVTGRVIAEFDLDVIKANPNEDTILENGDEILIPYTTQQVYIQGEVSNPGAIRYKPGSNLNYYIDLSGGILDTGDTKSIFIIYPNGETKNLKTSSRLSFISLENIDSLIYPGSVIFIPKSPDFTSGIEVAAVWAPILSSVALSLTSLSVLNNN